MHSHDYPCEESLEMLGDGNYLPTIHVENLNYISMCIYVYLPKSIRLMVVVAYTQPVTGHDWSLGHEMCRDKIAKNSSISTSQKDQIMSSKKIMVIYIYICIYIYMYIYIYICIYIYKCMCDLLSPIGHSESLWAGDWTSARALRRSSPSPRRNAWQGTNICLENKCRAAQRGTEDRAWAELRVTGIQALPVGIWVGMMYGRTNMMVCWSVVDRFIVWLIMVYCLIDWLIDRFIVWFIDEGLLMFTTKLQVDGTMYGLWCMVDLKSVYVQGLC